MLISHSINDQNCFISGWTDKSMLEFCDSLIEYFQNSSYKRPGTVNRPHAACEIDKKFKESTDCPLLKNSEMWFRYNDFLQKSVDNYIKQYPWCNNYAPWTIIENINIQYYKPSEAYHSWHTERGHAFLPDCVRHLVFMTYLNDVTDSGETEFFHQNIKVKPEKGLTLIWPADWTHTHRGIPSPSQEKFIVTGWFSFYSKESNE
jgi:hypothetical protein